MPFEEAFRIAMDGCACRREAPCGVRAVRLRASGRVPRVSTRAFHLFRGRIDLNARRGD